MRLLDRYLLRELLVPLAYCVSGFLLVWVVVDLVSELSSFQRYKVSALGIAEYYLLKAPENFVFVLPMALLLALLYALTNHARHQEITAIRSAGISLWRLCLPYFGVGFLASLLVLALNELCVAEFSDAAYLISHPPAPGALSREKVVGLSFNNSRDRRLWTIGIYNQNSGEMINPCVASSLPDGTTRVLYADRAVRINNGWVFYNAREYQHSAQSNFPPVLLLRTNSLTRAFTETPEEIKSEVKIRNILSKLVLKGNRKTDIPVTELFNYLRLHPDPEHASALYTKLHGRLATPWTCLVVVLLAAPFGAATGRRNVFVGVASSILIFFAYFVVQQVCLALGAGGVIPSMMAGWLPNFAFALAGLLMMSRAR